MKFNIWSWYGSHGSPPVPGAVPDLEEPTEWVIEVDDLLDFVKKHGPIQLRPPSPGGDDLFTIVVTDNSGQFKQK